MDLRPTPQIQELIDQAWERKEASEGGGWRHHLGASVIGKECMREIWFGFRWATRAVFKGRMLRLFNRGHMEEPRIVRDLRMIGVTVHEVDPETGEQFRIIDVDGHFGGSLDTIAYKVPGVELFGLTADDPVYVEYKTHNQKSFDNLVRSGLKKAKPEHIAQMQTYMLKRGIKLGLYIAVCKNTDDYETVFVTLDPSIGHEMLGKAREIITSPTPPPRISSNPGWFKCRFCDHRGVCHLGHPIERHCRSCKFAAPVADGKWHCSNWNTEIPKEAQPLGCEKWVQVDL